MGGFHLELVNRCLASPVRSPRAVLASAVGLEHGLLKTAGASCLHRLPLSAAARVHLSQSGLCFLEASKLPRKFHCGQILTNPSVSFLLSTTTLHVTLGLPLLAYLSG